MKKLIACLCTLLCLLIPDSVNAVCSSRLVDSTTGWTYAQPSCAHTGTKVITYYMDPGYEASYHERLTEGKNMWGSNISFQRVSSLSSANVECNTSASFPSYSANAFAVTTYPGGNTVLFHNKKYTLTVNNATFLSLSDFEKKLVYAHEIGHVYGLGHVNITSQIMYPNRPLSTMGVRAADLRGMKWMTHTHECSSSTSSTYNTYEWQDTTLHRKRCVSCKSYVCEVHTNGLTCTLCDTE